MIPRRRGRTALAALGLAVSLACTYLAVRGVDVEEFWQALRTSTYWWLLPSLAALAVTVALRAERWRVLFAPETRPPRGAAASALLIGLLFNSVLPARAGEAARVVALHQRTGASRAECVGTAVTERIYDVGSLLVLLFVAAPFLPPVRWLQAAAVLAAVLAAALVAALAALLVFGERPLRALLRPLARLPGVSVERTERAAANLVAGLGGLRRPRLVPAALALTVASWFTLALSFWLATLGFDLGVPFGGGLLLVIATNLAMILPSSPAAIGVFEAATVAALAVYGVGESRALSYAVVLHGVNFFPYVVVGWVVLHRHALVRRRTRLAA